MLKKISELWNWAKAGFPNEQERKVEKLREEVKNFSYPPKPELSPEVVAIVHTYKVNPETWTVDIYESNLYGYGFKFHIFTLKGRTYPGQRSVECFGPFNVIGLKLNQTDKEALLKMYDECKVRYLKEGELTAKRAVFETLSKNGAPLLPAVKLKPILLIDMDGVLFDYYGRFLSEWKYRYPDRIALEDGELTEFYIENMYPPEYKDDILQITRAQGFFDTIDPMPGAVEALGLILDCGEFEPFICTAPDNDCVGFASHNEKAAAVERHLGREWLSRLIMTKDKTLVAGDYMIDDKPNMKGLKIDNPPWKRVVFNQSYNQETPGFRLMNWNESWDLLYLELLEDFRK